MWSNGATVALAAAVPFVAGCPNRATSGPPEAPPSEGAPTQTSSTTPPPNTEPTSCSDGSGPACHQEGAAIEGNDAAAATDLYTRGCELKHGPSCTALGRLAALVRDDPARRDAAISAFERGCALDDGSACARLGAYVFHGNGVEADRSRAAELFARACDADVALGCRNLGMVLEGYPAPHDPTGAFDAMRRACALDDGPSCAQLGHYHYGGLGTHQDLDAAVVAYRRACELSFELGCVSAKNLELERQDTAGPWVRGVVLEKDGTRVLVELQSSKPLPEGRSFVLYEWAIRNEVRDWYEVADVVVRSRTGQQLDIRIKKLRPNLRTDDYIPLLPKAGVRLQWSAPGS